MGGSLQFLRLDTDLLAASTPGQVAVKIPATLWVASAEYTVRDFLFAAEYSRWLVKAESSNPAIFPESSTTSERAYALALGSNEVGVPAHWGGYRLYIDTIEFWQGRQNWLQDRLRYTRREEGWRIERLVP